MATKTTTKTKNKTNATKSEERTSGKGSTVTTIVVAKPTVNKGNGSHENIYEDAVKEVVALGQNDTYAKKIDNGPLSEARGKDTWRLHAQLRAVDQLDKNLSRYSTGIRGALSEVDEHLHTDTVAVTNLVTQYGNEITSKLGNNREAIQGWFGSTKESINNNIGSTKESINDNISSLQKTVKDSFSKLAQATAGSEENIRAQTDSFSKAVENLLGNLQHEFDKKITEFRDEATRLIDKRFNQSDVAFAAVRADQEVIKALLTDIIKDRLGRPEQRGR